MKNYLWTIIVVGSTIAALMQPLSVSIALVLVLGVLQCLNTLADQGLTARRSPFKIEDVYMALIGLLLGSMPHWYAWGHKVYWLIIGPIVMALLYLAGGLALAIILGSLKSFKHTEPS